MTRSRLGLKYWIWIAFVFVLILCVGALAYMFWAWGGWWIALAVLLGLIFVQNLIALPIKVRRHMQMARRW